MAYTDKQVRNGATGDSATDNTAQTGPMPDVAPLIQQAQDAAGGRGADGHGLMSAPQGSGPAASSGIADSDRVLGAGGNIWEWDSGLAISEMPGEQ